MPDDIATRLPRSVVPSRYELELEPDLAQAVFTGTVAIDVDVAEPVARIVLNAAELAIDEAWVEAAGERSAATVSEAGDEQIALDLAAPLEPGSATVRARFRGILNDKLRGFYRSTFTDAAGVEQVIATTQFESTDARRAFPCWDEPDFKARFSVTLVVPADQMVISNAAEIERTEVPGGKVRVRFAETMPLPTYLVAFVVGPFEATAAVDVDGVPLRVVAPEGKGHLGRFALEIGEFSLRYFTEYFGVRYPGDKVDLVAIPDFAFGAMENLGCVTFRETALLIDPTRAMQPELERVADVVAHELAHMWFGDLVTMKWWNGIWLNEAFATFMETLAVDAFRPEWERWVSFGLSRTAAYDTDALAATRAIEYPVITPADAEGMFDVLTYEKGCSVVRMLEQYVGADRFRTGIREYISKHAYGNTETSDLWDALEAATGEPIRRIADSWIFQGGHPVVAADLEADGATARLSQRRFRYLGDDEGERWSVPLLLRIGHRDGTTSDIRVLLEGDAAGVELDRPASWYVANAGGHGFYRIAYSSKMLAALSAQAADQLDPLERYNLIDDVWASTVAGTTALADTVRLLRSFGDETDVNVWRRIVGALHGLHRICSLPDRPAVAAFVRELLTPALDRLGRNPQPGEPANAATLRGLLFETLGTIGEDAGVRQQAAELDRLVVEEAVIGDRADAALIDATVRVLAGPGDAARFESYLARSKSAPTPQDTLRYLGALADFEDPQLYDRALGLTLTATVRSQDMAMMLVRALHNPTNGSRGWEFIAARWDALLERMPVNMAGRAVGGVRVFTDAALAGQVEAFLDEHPVPNAAKAIDQHIERMWVSVAFAAREGFNVAAALA